MLISKYATSTDYAWLFLMSQNDTAHNRVLILVGSASSYYLPELRNVIIASSGFRCSKATAFVHQQNNGYEIFLLAQHSGRKLQIVIIAAECPVRSFSPFFNRIGLFSPFC